MQKIIKNSRQIKEKKEKEEIEKENKI